jgi:hypothetical protein
MIEYQIAIPSYQRYEMLKNKTLNTLKKHKINSNLITIFVANQKQFDEYSKGIPKSMYNKLIIGKKGLKNQRNFINSYYPENTYLIQMDDDIDDIVELINPDGKKHTSTPTYRKKNQLIPIKNLNLFFKNAFKLCRSEGTFLWGIYPLANPYFMNFKTNIGLKFIVGPLWGCIVRHNAKLKLTIDEKENVERTLQYYSLDGKVIRFNNISIVTKYYKNPGGMQSNSRNRKKNALKSVKYLHNKYPNLTKIKLTKKSGFPEIVLTSLKK